MRFAYSPDTGQFEIYATPDEFQLASLKTPEKQEFRVLQKNFKNLDRVNNELHEDAIVVFLEEYVSFVTNILQDLFPENLIQDILVLSTSKKFGFEWGSLFDPEKSGASTNFSDLFISYIEQILGEAGENPKILNNTVSERDIIKFALARGLLNSIEHPSIWEKKSKLKKEKANFAKQMEAAKQKLVKFEKKYNFTTEEMMKYYKDDEDPEKGIADWMDTYLNYTAMKSMMDKQEWLEKAIDNWQQTFGDTIIESSNGE